MAINIIKNKNYLVYQVKVRDTAGKWLPSRCFRDKLEAQKYELELISRRQLENAHTLADGYQVTVGEYWSVWSVENRANVSDGWKQSQDQIFRDYIQPIIGTKIIREVSPVDITRCLNAGRNNGLSEQSTKHIYSLLRRLFGDASELYEMIPKNPVKARFHRPKVVEKERPFLPPTLSWKLLDECRDHYAAPAVWLQTLAGLRPEAVVALLWDSVDFNLNQILIRRAWKKKVRRMEDFPKGKKWEYVPMIPPLREFLLDLWNRSDKDPQSFVCRNYTGLTMLPYDTYEGVLKTLCQNSGLPRMTPHLLRHSCTEIWVQHGASGEDLRRLLNHSDLSVTKRYMHRTDERLTSIGSGISRPKLVLVESNLNSGTQNVPEYVPDLEQTNVCEHPLDASPLKKYCND